MRLHLSLPVLMKEMRSRMRGMRAPVLLFITTGLAIGLGLIIILTASSGDYAGSDYGDMANIGRALFVSMMILQGILCALITPAVTAGAITIEKEQQTLEMLMLTRLSCANIVLGKYCSALGFLLVVLLCSLPVTAVSFLLGGVDMAQLAWSLGIIISLVMLFGAIGVFCSARYQRTATAVAVTYLLAVLWVLLIPIAGGIEGGMIFSNSYNGNNINYTPMFLFVTVACCLALTWIPTAILSLLISAIIRRSVPRLVNFMLWLLLAASGIYVLIEYQTQVMNLVKNLTMLWGLIGNPVYEAMLVLSPETWLQIKLPVSVEHYFLPASLGLTVLCAGLVLAAAARELKRLRDAPPPAVRRQRKPGKKQPNSAATPAEV